MLESVGRKLLSVEVFEQLRDRVVSGALSPGDRLPAERDLCAQLGVSRSAVREALKRMQQAGLVRVKHGGGIRVLDYRRHAGLDLLTGLFVDRLGVPNPRVVCSVVELRALLAPSAVALCARRATPEVDARLDAALAALLRTQELGDRQRASQALWAELIAGSGNLAILLAFNSLLQAYALAADTVARFQEPELRHDAGFIDMVAAVQARDEVAAAAAVRTHVALGLAPALAFFSGEHDPESVLTPISLAAPRLEAP